MCQTLGKQVQKSDNKVFFFFKRTEDMKTHHFWYFQALVLMFMHVSAALNKSYKTNFCV